MRPSGASVGRLGEEQAARYLIGLGHSIVARNWRSSHLELDIVSIKGRELHIVEVKSRTVPAELPPEAGLSAAKKRRMVAAAKAFLNSEERMRLPSDLDVHFDAITVLVDGQDFEIEYYPQVFIPIYA